MRFSFDPAVISLIALAIGLFARAVRVLGRRGYRVPAGQQAAWYGGMALTAIGLLSPIDTLGPIGTTANADSAANSAMAGASG